MDRKDLKPTLFTGKEEGDVTEGLSRRSFFMAAGGLGLGAAATTLASTQQAEAQSLAWMQPGNNNHVIELQEADSYAGGAVGIDFYGHCAIKITSPGGATVLFDPLAG